MLLALGLDSIPIYILGFSDLKCNGCDFSVNLLPTTLLILRFVQSLMGNRKLGSVLIMLLTNP